MAAVDEVNDGGRTIESEKREREEEADTLTPWEQHASIISIPRFDYKAPSSLLHHSHSGFLVTCTIKREKSATKEVMSILGKYIGSMHEEKAEVLKSSDINAASKKQKICAPEIEEGKGKTVPLENDALQETGENPNVEDLKLAKESISEEHNSLMSLVGGKLTALEEHIAAAKSNCLFEGTDFKLASCHHPLNDKVAQECGFTSLSIRVVEELVTFSPCPPLKPPEISNAGKHLSAAEFHSVLQRAIEHPDGDGKSEKKELVLFDARNLYETRIGKFESENVETLDPEIRQFSDLPTWIDQNSEKLKGKNVLMYCTGGIRCEMASAYIRSKGAGFENTFQLYGGIQRYLEQFPSGGFFKGKNFVFDHRISVGSSKEDIIGSCLLCNNTFDDYSPRCRCRLCRMLVLVCNHCRVKGDIYVCELCRKHGKGEVPLSLDPSNQPIEKNGDDTRRKLRILCLHGFRQNASGFKGRTGSLAKKLKNIAELVFIDAPHELQFIYQTATPPSGACNKKFAWLVSPDFDKPSETGWTAAQCQLDPLQYQNQTEGFDKSLTYLKTAFAEKGPFDGILGFSQGAAMAAAVCRKQEQLICEIDFRFCVLCSGFTPWPLLEKNDKGSIKYPSLHIFGSQPGKDRQIVTRASSDLAGLFDDGCATIIEHNFGHIIPTKPPYIDDIKAFLYQFI